VLDLDFDLDATGFEMGEIDLRIEGLSQESDEQGDPCRRNAACASGPPVCQVGDLWLLAAIGLLR